MIDEIKYFIDKIEICQETNKQANLLIKNHNYSDFTKCQLRMIAELSATKSIELNREVKQKLAEWEMELAEAQKIYRESEG